MRNRVRPAFIAGLIVVLLAATAAPQVSANHGSTGPIYYRALGSYTPLGGHCSVHLIPNAQLDCNPSLNDPPAGAFTTMSWGFSVSGGTHSVRFDDVLGDVGFKANGQLCQTACWVTGSFIEITIDPAHFSLSDLAAVGPLPTAGSFSITWG